MTDFTLLHPLWLLPAVLLFAAFLWLRSDNHNAWHKVISAPVLNYLQRHHNQSSKRNPALLLACLSCVALSGPAIRASDSNTFQHSQGFIVLLDVSRSMTLTDVIPSRMSALRDAAIQLADRARANSTTLIVYAGDAFVISPPSFDTALFKANVNLLKYGTVPMDGSNLTRALSLAWSVIEGSSMVGARLFVLSDTGGFNTRSDAAVARLASLGHRTDVILFGRDDAGNAAPFDLAAAANLADSGNGVLLHADTLGSINFAKLDLNQITTDGSLLTQTGITTLRWANQSHWLLLFGIPLWLIAFRRELE